MTPEEALAIYCAGRAAVIATLCRLSAKVTTLETEIAKLRKDSSTSSKPPSSDITKPPRESKAGERKLGAQPGHPKQERSPWPEEQIDAAWDYHALACAHCGHDDIVLLDLPPRVIQQVELKQILTRTEEHRAHPYFCNACGSTHYTPLPEAIVREGWFKTHLTAPLAYLSRVCHASFSSIRKFLRDILKLPVSRGYLAKLVQKFSGSLQRPYAELLQRLPLQTQLNVDETGHRENGKRLWTWVFKAELYVLFRIDQSRSSAVLLEVLGKEFEGTLGCDYFSAYRKYMRECNVTVQFCLAHLIRDVKFLCKLPDQDTRAYGEKLLDALKALFKLIHGREQMTPAQFHKRLHKAKRTILDIGCNQAPSHRDDQGKERKKHAQNIARRFRLHGRAYFQFITTPGMDPTNNVAEQAIRFVVIDRHVTQGTRSAKGRTANERLWTVIATCALQGRSAFEFILQALRAELHAEPPPSLLPRPP